SQDAPPFVGPGEISGRAQYREGLRYHLTATLTPCWPGGPPADAPESAQLLPFHGGSRGIRPHAARRSPSPHRSRLPAAAETPESLCDPSSTQRGRRVPQAKPSPTSDRPCIW